MPDISITIKNLPQIRAAFNAAPRFMNEEFSKAIMKSTLYVQGQSMLRTPVLTGRLRASHTTRYTGSGVGFTGTVEPTANYAIYVHEGTRYMRGRPFLKQGLEASENTIQKLFTQAMQSVLNKIANKT